jgi:glycosyltransferase involved in cell wall biosynthesis
VVPPAQPAALAAAIVAVLKLQPAERRALGDSLRRRVERDFRIDDAIEAYVALYRTVA